MPYAKRSSKVLEKAERRMSSLISIDTALDLGSGLTLQTYSSNIEIVRQKLAAYNTVLSNLTQLYNEMLESEQQLADLNERMLTGVVTKYGRNSTEYEMAGGKRKRQKRAAKSTPAASTNTGASTASTAPTSSVSATSNGKTSSN